MTIENPVLRDVVRFENKDAYSRDAAHRFVALAAQSRSAQRPFTVALTGGSSPTTLYRLLTEPPCRGAVDWDGAHFFFGDDRAVAPDDENSNYRLARETLFAPLNTPEANIHRIVGELPDHDEAARRYEAELKAFFGLEDGQFPRFDLILLGMGPDGHCASLFPHKPALREQTRLAVASEPGLAPFVPRITLTRPILNAAANVLFMVPGADKAETVARILEGPPDFDALPSQSIQPTQGTLTWLLDKDAARLLKV